MSARVLTAIVTMCGECPHCEVRRLDYDRSIRDYPRYCRESGIDRGAVIGNAPPPDWCPLPKAGEEAKR